MTGVVPSSGPGVAPGVEVEPYVVLYAIRYGLGRSTYAHSDAHALIRDHWPILRHCWAASIRDDVDLVIRLGTAPRDIANLCRTTLNWIDRQEQTHDDH